MSDCEYFYDLVEHDGPPTAGCLAALVSLGVACILILIWLITLL